MTAEPVARSPLEGWRAELERLGAREVRPGAQVSLRVRDAADPHPLAPADVPNTWTTIDGREVLWLGPDEWLAVSEHEEPAVLLAWAETRLAGTFHAVVDVSDARAVLELGDADRLELLAAGCGLDLHPSRWRPGTCAQTLLGNVQVLLQEREGSTRVCVRPSFAGHLVRFLLAVRPA
ncbi:MAG: sarcosine oxidase subunit gamma [Candidatus Velamenicoccus archaeovorus]